MFKEPSPPAFTNPGSLWSIFPLIFLFLAINWLDFTRFFPICQYDAQ